jgi:hypothetical protein
MTQETHQSDGTVDPIPGSTDIRATIARLETAPRDVLIREWQKAYRSAPPKGASRQFLFAAVAHSLQLKQYGISATKLRRRLERHEKRQASGPKATQKLAPGTRLIREWNGSTHTVDVTDDGYRWNGEHFRSLSAIARAITGTRWSGPRFFGLDREGVR